MKYNIRKIIFVMLIILGISIGIGGCSQISSDTPVENQEEQSTLNFKNEQHLKEHYQKHVIDQKEFGDITLDEYLKLAQALMDHTPDYVLTKKDGDDTLYYDKETNSFGVKSKQGFIRTFFKPSDGIKYFERQ